jgi:hypothetical protein
MLHSYNTIVKLAPGKGRGVFARRSLKPNEVVEIAPILIIPEEDSDLVYASFLTEYWYETNPDSKTSFIALGHASLYNHDDDPNADYEVSLENKSITIRALRTISQNEEITISYGFHPLIAQYEDQVDSVLSELFTLQKHAERLNQPLLQKKIQSALSLLTETSGEDLISDAPN